MQMTFLPDYTLSELAWIGGIIFLLGMSKGGFPISSIALPLLVLVWPGAVEPARSAVAFLLPVLCLMDVVALLFYRKHVDMRRLVPLLPGSLVGVAIASILFVSKEAAPVEISDRVLKFIIGLIGFLFVLYSLFKKWVLKRLEEIAEPGFRQGTGFGVAAGISSTIAHAAGPLIQMYLLPQKLPKMKFVATTAAYFMILNQVKLVPFLACGRIEVANLRLAAAMVPLIPVGVGAGYVLVRLMKPGHYVGLIYAILFITSVVLMVKSVVP